MDAFEIGYCLVTKKGEILAPFIPNLSKKSSTHLQQYYSFLKSEKLYRKFAIEGATIEKITLPALTKTVGENKETIGQQYLSDFKNLDTDPVFLKGTDGENFFQKIYNYLMKHYA